MNGIAGSDLLGFRPERLDVRAIISRMAALPNETSRNTCLIGSDVPCVEGAEVRLASSAAPRRLDRSDVQGNRAEPPTCFDKPLNIINYLRQSADT